MAEPATPLSFSQLSNFGDINDSFTFGIDDRLRAPMTPYRLYASFDGGSSALATTELCRVVERYCAAPFAEIFSDGVAGAATGGLLAALYSLPGAKTRLNYSAEQVQELFLRKIPLSFTSPKSVITKIWSYQSSPWEPQYYPEPLDEVLAEVTQGRYISELYPAKVFLPVKTSHFGPHRTLYFCKEGIEVGGERSPFGGLKKMVCDLPLAAVLRGVVADGSYFPPATVAIPYDLTPNPSLVIGHLQEEPSSTAIGGVKGISSFCELGFDPLCYLSSQQETGAKTLLLSSGSFCDSLAWRLERGSSFHWDFAGERVAVDMTNPETLTRTLEQAKAVLESQAERVEVMCQSLTKAMVARTYNLDK